MRQRQRHSGDVESHAKLVRDGKLPNMTERARVSAPLLYFNHHDLTDVLARETGFLLSYVAQMGQLALDKSLEPLDIDARQLGVLILIGESEHRSQIAISQNMGLDRSHVVRLVDDLEDLNYVHREKDAADRRYYKLVLTEVGEVVLKEARLRSKHAEDGTYSCLSKAERETLTSLLRKVAEQRFSREQSENIQGS